MRNVLAFYIAWLAATMLALPAPAEVTQGYAPLLRSTKQVPSENLPPQEIVVGTNTYLSTAVQTYTRTGTLTNGLSTGTITTTRPSTTLGNGYLYGANGIGFVTTSTLTTTASYTQTNTSTLSSSSSFTVTGTGTISGTATTTRSQTNWAANETFTYPQTMTKTMTATAIGGTGTYSSATNQTGVYQSTHTVTGSQTYTSTTSATASGTVTATGAYTGTGTATGTVSGSNTGTGTGTQSDQRIVTVTRTISSTSTASGIGNTWTVTDSAAATGTSSKTATYMENSLTMTATKTATGTWTSSSSSSGYGTDTLTASNTFTVTTTSNSAGFDVGPTQVQTNRQPGGAYIVDNDGCSWAYGICPVTAWRHYSQGGVPSVSGVTSGSGVVQIIDPSNTHYEPANQFTVNYADRRIWPAGTWTMRVRAEASSLRYPSYVRMEIVVFGKHKPTGTYPDGQQSCTGDVNSVIPTGLIVDLPVTMEGNGGREGTLDAYIGGPSASVEQTITKNFHYEPNYPSGWNTQCTNLWSEEHPPVHLGVRISAYTASPDPVDIYFYTADLDSPVPAMP